MELHELRNLALIAERVARQEDNHATADALREFAVVCVDDFRASNNPDASKERLSMRRLSSRLGTVQRIN